MTNFFTVQGVVQAGRSKCNRNIFQEKGAKVTFSRRDFNFFPVEISIWYNQKPFKLFPKIKRKIDK